MNQEELLQLIDQAAEDGREKLDLSRKGLTELPEEISKLTNLKILELGNNQISKIPDVIAELKNLTKLNLSCNQISEIPNAISKLENLEVLVLNDNQISEIPDAISKLESLTKLYLHSNQISKIPDVIAKLKNLTELSLHDNQISEIPDVISELKNLTFLSLGSNQISEIPDVIAELKNLTKLYLSGNKISKISEAITDLKKLTELYLSYNEISKIPHAISELKNLKTLDFRNNQISEIPEIIIHLENLESDQNKMTEGIDVRGNPIINPPYEIVEKGIYAIRSYFLTQQLSRYKDDDTLKIERSIEFPPEYWTAGTSILSYFSHILSIKYPDQNIKVRIEQEGLLLRMIIDTPTGQTELIEQTLNEYSMVITGKLPPESFLNNPFEVMALKNKLEMTQLELKMSKELFAITNSRDIADIVDLKTQVRELQSIIGKGLQSKDNKSDLPITVNVTVNANDHLSQNHTNQHGQGDNFGGDNVNQDKIGRDKVQRG